MLSILEWIFKMASITIATSASAAFGIAKIATILPYFFVSQVPRLYLRACNGEMA
jgi:hypothetical protein